MLKFSVICSCSVEHRRQLHGATSDMLSKLHAVMHAVDNLHLKHRQLAGNYQKQRDSSAWNRAEQKRLKGIFLFVCGWLFFEGVPSLIVFVFLIECTLAIFKVLFYTRDHYKTLILISSKMVYWLFLAAALPTHSVPMLYFILLCAQLLCNGKLTQVFYVLFQRSWLVLLRSWKKANTNWQYWKHRETISKELRSLFLRWETKIWPQKRSEVNKQNCKILKLPTRS